MINVSVSVGVSTDDLENVIRISALQILSTITDFIYGKNLTLCCHSQPPLEKTLKLDTTRYQPV